MKQKEITIKAFFKSYDENYKKLTLLFLDDEVEPFTKSFLTKYYSSAQNNPIKYGEFSVKHDVRKSRVYIDKGEQILAPIQDLLDQIVEMTVFIRHYNFTDKSGKKIIGWNINLVKMIPVCYS